MPGAFGEFLFYIWFNDEEKWNGKMSSRQINSEGQS